MRDALFFFLLLMMFHQNTLAWIELYGVSFRQIILFRSTVGHFA